MDKARCLQLFKIARAQYPPILCFEGVSCVGKSHAINFLKQSLNGKKILVHHNPSSSKLGLKLLDWVRKNSEFSNSFLLACFFLITQNDLYEDMQKISTLEYDLIILDRMVFFSGIVHQGYNGGNGFVACEKSLQLLSLAMDFFFAIDKIFLLTDDPKTILNRRETQQNVKKYKSPPSENTQAIAQEQLCYIEFASKIHTINRKMPEPHILDMSNKDSLQKIVDIALSLIAEREFLLT